MKITTLVKSAVLTVLAFGLASGLPNIPVPRNAVSGNASVVTSSGLPGATSSAPAASVTGRKIVLRVTDANSRGAASVKPKVIATVTLDAARSVLSTLSVPGIPFVRFRRRVQQVKTSANRLFSRAMPALRWPYTSTSSKIRGVNLGGWLVIEPFITPGVFAATGNANIVDEWTFGSLQPRGQATKILQNHLNTFLSESDIRQIASAGLNHVRIPIGYWAFEVAAGEPYLKLNQWDLLKQAARVCAKYNIKVLVDLHTAPGNQNGFEHGGRAGVNQWANDASNINRTVNILQTMSKEFSQSQYANSVTAIELLNEPVQDQNVLIDFYIRAYEVVRYPTGRNGPVSPLLIAISDGFISPAVSDYWNNKALPPQYEGVAIDSHVYTIFSAEQIALSPSERLAFYCSLKLKWAIANSVHPQIIGEWTPAYTDCANGVNGRNAGSKAGTSADCYARTGDASTFTTDYKKMLGRMWEAQVDSSEGGKGWFMWTWKTEAKAAEDWSYQKGLQYGWIPRDPTQRPQGVICDNPATYGM